MKKILFFLTVLAFAKAQAQNFYDFSAVSSSGDTLYYLIEDGNAVLTCSGDIDEDEYWTDFTQPESTLVIDPTVTYDNNTYNVVAIGEYALYGCSGITSVSIPSTVNRIGDYAFYNCINLASVDIPATLSNFGSYLFSGCMELTEPIYQNGTFVYMPISATGVYTIPDQITRICGGAFYRCASLTHVVIPNSVTEIGAGAFLDCDGLTQPLYNNTLFARLPLTYSGSYTIPDGILTVCASSFVRDTGLTELIMPNSVTSMGNGAFSSCTALVSLSLSDALTAIPSFAFMGCTALPTVTLPASVTRIGNLAFRNCTSLDTLVVKSTTPPSTSTMSLRNIPQSCILIVPCGSLDAYTEAWASSFADIIEDCHPESVDVIADSDINVFSREGRIVVEGADGQQVTVFDIMGRSLREFAAPSTDFSPLSNGIYLVKVGNLPARKVAVIR